MIRETGDVSFHVFGRPNWVVMRLNKENFRMSTAEALRLADALVDCVENKETA